MSTLKTVFLLIAITAGAVQELFAQPDTEVQKLFSITGESNDRFGKSVSVSGEYAIVGAHGDDDRGNESGSSYIYYRDQGGADNWGLVTKLTAMDGATDDRFGYSVNLSDDHAIAGAFENCENGYMSGAAYIFNRNQGGPDQWGVTLLRIRSLIRSSPPIIATGSGWKMILTTPPLLKVLHSTLVIMWLTGQWMMGLEPFKP